MKLARVSARPGRFARTVAAGVAVLLWSLGTRAAPLVISYPQEENAFHAAAAAIISEAYGALGLEAKFVTLPSERSLYASNTGEVDGELVRIAGITNKYPNLIQVPVSHVSAEQMAFVLDPKLKITDWESLRPYRLVFHRGYKAAEANTQGMNVYLVDHGRQTFAMVASERADVAIANRFSGLKELQALGNTRVQMKIPPLQVDPLYHYVHVKHRELVPKLTEALQRMRNNGRMQAIYRKFGVEPLTQTAPAADAMQDAAPVSALDRATKN